MTTRPSHIRLRASSVFSSAKAKGLLTFAVRGNSIGYFDSHTYFYTIGGPVTERPNEDRSPIAVAFEWSSRITGISLELVLPTLGGYWLDQRFGTGVLMLLLGAGIGFASATLSLMRLTQGKDRQPPRNKNTGDKPTSESDGR